jgi:putative hydrolase of the HAD superfamily
LYLNGGIKLSVKAIVFDYGQVISLPQDPAVPGELARMAGVEREKFEPLLWSLRGEYDRGVITVREYYRNIFARLDISKNDNEIDEMIKIDLTSWQNINAETVALMEDVKKAGYTLGILSNMPHDFLAWARKNVPAFSLPHISLFSCELNLIKPEAAIFRETISRFGVKSGELVFFDDNTDNVKSACALGIEAFLWKGSENARRELASLGVRL